MAKILLLVAVFFWGVLPWDIVFGGAMNPGQGERNYLAFQKRMIGLLILNPSKYVYVCGSASYGAASGGTCYTGNEKQINLTGFDVISGGPFSGSIGITLNGTAEQYLNGIGVEAGAKFMYFGAAKPSDLSRPFSTTFSIGLTTSTRTVQLTCGVPAGVNIATCWGGK